MRPPASLPAAALVAIALVSLAPSPALAQPAAPSRPTPAALYTDPPHDTAHPARMQVLHIASGGVRINGVAYLAAGAGTHATVVILHGLPGNEKNLDLAQAVRRAGWNAVTFNYRGSWGSPGSFRFAQNLEDADAVLAFLRDTASSRTLGIDTTRIVLAGHSMGGWVAARTAAHDARLRGLVLISAADMARGASYGAVARPKIVATMAGNMESLAGTTPEQMADELIAHAGEWGIASLGPALARMPLLVLTSDDGLAPHVEGLVAAARATPGSRVTAVHVATDHGWNDSRIALETNVLRWLATVER